MRKWKYRKKGPSDIQEICIVCNERPQLFQPYRGVYLPYCRPCKKKLYGNGCKEKQKKRVALAKRPYTRYKKNSCEECGFIPVHSCQLDVDHKDGDHHNNDPTNLQTLCANCHRLKTYRQKDWEPR